MNTLRCLAAAASALTLAACLSSTTSRPLDCGPGDDVVFAGEGFCVYAAALIIEGFYCPAAVPHRFTGGGGDVICSGREDLPPGEIAAILDQWRDGQPLPSDAATLDIDPGDTAGAPDAAADPLEDTGPTPIPTFCETELAGGLGDAVALPGRSACVVAAVCGVGARAVMCGTVEALHCACVYGDVTCTPRPDPTCAPVAQPVGASCDPALGARACAEGLRCDAASTLCVALPAPCSEVACFDQAACDAAGPARCYGATLATGDAGFCAAAPPAGQCRDDADCPVGWTCAGAGTACDACGCSATVDTLGSCQAAGPPSLGLTAAERTTDPSPRARWGYGAGEVDVWVDCPGFTVEVRDERDHAWVAAGGEVGCEEGVLRRLAVGELLTSAPLELDLAGAPWAWVRVTGAVLSGCAEGLPASYCAGAPTPLTSARRLVEAP